MINQLDEIRNQIDSIEIECTAKDENKIKHFKEIALLDLMFEFYKLESGYLEYIIKHDTPF